MNKFKLFLLSFAIFSSLSSSALAAQATSTNDAEMKRMILHYINVYRTQHHLAALSMNETISQEAEMHSKKMASHAIPFGHAHFNARLKHIYQQLDHCNGAAENVAYYQFNAKKLVEAWIASPGHRRNIVGPYNLTGIGIAHGKEGWAYYTQIFVKKEHHKYA